MPLKMGDWVVMLSGGLLIGQGYSAGGGMIRGVGDQNRKRVNSAGRGCARYGSAGRIQCQERGETRGRQPIDKAVFRPVAASVWL